ncbi:hypothetical protein ATEIFO6365_0002032500 [Aspergillus terreus]|uniref:Uncharacterized protein n=1 Tax=Aspergillus terreus TaxID=33178 RepID=A0A5M3YXY6_ASPTE|nr:hypothetical protein ATETN484_0004032500 [Aspergillus terreus]GFF13215.1 hypothetical protein ATEIFO6365_0002032500 [Aspergillus terreus]
MSGPVSPRSVPFSGMQYPRDTPTSPPSPETKTVNIQVHGLKAHYFLDRPPEDLVPARYLRKADTSPVVQRAPWIFRAPTTLHNADVKHWSKVDIRFRGVFQTLEKVPSFRAGLYEDDHGRLNDDDESPPDFHDAAGAQGLVIYALLHEILTMIDIRREAESHKSFFCLRPRLFSLNLEYWTGYQERHKDGPRTAGLVTLTVHPEQSFVRAVFPVSTTTRVGVSLESALQDKFKLLLAQFLLNIHRLHPPGDKIPDQEVYLLGLHGSRLHLLRGIFPGHKTSRLWSGRHIPSPTGLSASADEEAAEITVQMEPGRPAERFYSKTNLERFMQRVDWLRLSACDNEPDPRVFRVLGSREYDLWVAEDFRAAMRLLVGLFLYLMSGRARCGVLQDMFEMFPYDEEDDPESEGEASKGKEKAAREEKQIAEKERELEERERQKREADRERFWTREAMRGSANDRIAGLRDSRQPWWDWVWEDKSDDGQRDDADVIFRGP